MEFMKEMLGQIIKLLEDGKAVEQEWDFEGNLIMPLKDMKNGVIESASHSSRTDPDDETIAVHMSRTRGSKVRGKLSSWVKSLTGKAKTAT
ncbi:hypothetical protein PGQ11_002513 [Apiospora arundinis]|uniref:Uncharacterized protein n=1 Tax=Apiospora arundinis TaxID=335852 RepID=A0ABR2JJQ7_9PEZI